MKCSIHVKIFSFSTECTQIRFLSENDVPALLGKALPPEWLEGDVAQWYPGDGNYNHPSKSWLNGVWRYLRETFPKLDDLFRLENLPLIPLDLTQVPVILTRLKRPSKVVAKLDSRLEKPVVDVLKVLGVMIMQECPLRLHPALLHTFVHPPCVQGVLHSMDACTSSSIRSVGMLSAILLEKVDAVGKRALRNFVSKARLFHQEEKELLLYLPLFETLSKKFVSKKEVLRTAPKERLPVTPRRELIDIKEASSERLAHLLDIRIPETTEHLCEEVFPDVIRGHYSGEEIDRLMAFVLKRYHVYTSHEVDARFEDMMKEVPFVSTKSGRMRALDLFDPRQDLLKTLFAGEDVFPVGTQYTDPAVLAVLERLGMKNEKMIAAQDLYQIAKSVTENSSTSTTRQKSMALMGYLTRNPTKLEDAMEDGRSLRLLLLDIAWVPVLKQKPHGFPDSLHFFGETEKERYFYKPTEVKSREIANLIGSVQPIIDVSSSELVQCFGGDKNPCVLDVVEHLRTVIVDYKRDEKPQYVLMVKDIYSFLSAADYVDVLKALQRIKIPSWIWNGDGFSSPKVVLSEKPSIELSPYICALPLEMIQYSNLFFSFGMQKRCDDSLLLDVLAMIQEKYDRTQFEDADVKKDLKLSIDILNEVKPKVGKLPELQKKILLPTYVEGDAYVKLAPVESCMYCEDGWLDTENDDEEMQYLMVHPNVPNSTAERLNVRNISNCMLDPDELAVGEGFGQEEKLTRRLSSLLEDYTDGFAVPKELIQNADDAGATEVNFLYDERANEDATTCLIDEGMRHCQGPALWVYNDAEFRDEDFENITKLSGATKEHDTEKIGKFGLGFNAVYNLTDVPMFVSRNHFVIFDPNTFYLGKAIRNKAKPGMKININKNAKKLRKFRNQFKPFNGIFGCDLHLEKEDNSYKGTLFRFPLRTKEQAMKSEIRKSDYDSKQMKELLQRFICGAGSLLLFTQNVRRVSIFHLASDSTGHPTPKKIYEVAKSLSEAGIRRELPCPVILPPAADRLSDREKFLLEQSNILRAASDVAKHKGDAVNSNTVLLRSALTINVSSTITEYGRCFFGNKLDVCSDVGTWLVVSSMGRGQAMQFSEKDKSLLPSAGVAVKLSHDDFLLPVPVCDESSGSDRTGNVFCYLPLPIHSGLPVHVNGAFAVASNRRNLKENTEDDKASIGVEWNNVLLQDSVCAAYLDLLEDLKSATETSRKYQFFSLWPKSCEVRSNCEPLARSLYECLANRGNSLFSDGSRWVSISEIVFLDPQFHKGTQVGDISFEVLQLLANDNQTVIDLPGDVYQSFVDYGLGKDIQAKSYDKERFFRELFFPNIASVPAHLRDKLVLYALNDNSGAFQDMIRNNGCVPASPNGQKLKCPSQLVHPSRRAALLFCDEDGRFPFGTDETFRNLFQLCRLEQLGMATDDLSWGEVAERAESINHLNRSCSDAALKRAKNLIAFLEGKLKDGNIHLPLDVQRRLLEAEFLPVLKKPQGFPLTWKGSQFDDGTDLTFVSPNEGFLRDKMYLVCCTEPIVDLSISPEVKLLLKFDDRQATTMHAMSQLNEAISTRIDISGMEEVRKVCNASYCFLQEALEDDEIQIADFLRGKKFILVRNEFVSVNQVAFELPVECSPYLFKVPEELARRFSRLMKKASVRNMFEAQDFISGLRQIHEEHGFGERQLDRPTRLVAVHLANELAKALKAPGGEFTTDDKRTSIHLPNSKGVMLPVSELCIQDCPWIPGSPDVQFVSPDIPCTTSVELGVKTRREEALRHHSLGLSFGQKEELTNRLKRILTGYPCGKDLLKELLQNADDAQATKIVFIKDPRDHPTERVFEESWVPLQGPALCVYNNKPFTKADIAGIQNLGEGSKGNDQNKTGQYGVGFNAVYHLTDVPSFMSNGEEIGDVLCVFDPHCQYVPDANSLEPGRMYTEITKLKDLFPDVFNCYLEEHFPLENSTMFRFPLRTQEMARDSKISSNPVTLEGLNKMMDALKKELFEVLIFVNNVKKICLCDIDESGQVVNCYSVEAVMTEEDAVKRQKFAAHIQQIGKSDEQRNYFYLNNIKVEKCSYVLNLRDSLGNEEKWLIVQQIGCENEVQPSIAHAYRNSDLGMLPRGGVAYLLENKSIHKEPERRRGKAYCFLPLPLETGLPVHINGHFALEHEARRGLWKDESVVYWTDWNSTLLKDVIASCYLTLLDEVRSFLQLPILPTENLSCSKAFLIKKLEIYEKLFPCCSNLSDPYWEMLARSVYREMNSKKLRFLPVVRDVCTNGSMDGVELTWLPPTGTGKNQAFFNDLETSGCFGFGRKDDSVENRRSLERILLQTGFNLVQFSMAVFKAFYDSEVFCCCITPHNVMKFYKTFNSQDPLCKIGSIPMDVEKTPFKDSSGVILVLRYCRDLPHFLNSLSGLPLLVTQDNWLRAFSESDRKFLSFFHDILPKSKKMFVHEQVMVNIFNDAGSRRASVFMQFNVDALALQLSDTLPSGSFEEWCPTSTEIPNGLWISRVWSFLATISKGIVNDTSRRHESVVTRIRSMLKPLSDWGILPAKQTVLLPRSDDVNACEEVTKNILVPVKWAESVLDFPDRLSRPLVDALRRLGLPELNSDVLAIKDMPYSAWMDSCFLARQVVASLETPASLLTSLDYKLSSSPDSLVGRLKPQDCVIILKYFNDNAQCLQNSPSCNSTLKKLPFYLSTHGDLISLHKHERVCVLPDGVPTNEMDVLQRVRDVVFLKAVPSLSNLYQILAFDSISPVDVYCNFILVLFKAFSKDVRLAHLEYVRDNVLPSTSVNKEDEKRLLDRLASSEIITTTEGHLKRASYFHDPCSDILKAMLPGEMFPPEPFTSKEWLSFLRKIGMVYEISPDHFKKFAEEVALEAATQRSVKTDEKSKLLVSQLLNRSEALSHGLLLAVRGIPFVVSEPVSSDLLALHGQYGERKDGQSPYIAFEDFVVSEHAEIVWTTAHLLPRWADPRFVFKVKAPWNLTRDAFCKNILARLKVVSEPALDLVTSHCQNICNHLVTENGSEVSEEQCLRRKSVMKSIYKFLQEKATTNDDLKHVLQSSPCILVEQGTRFVEPKQVVLELYESLEIKPFLYGVPHELGEFHKLFLLLGCSRSVTTSHYAMVLEMLHDQCQGEKLHPNEIQSALGAVRGFFEKLQEHPSEGESLSKLFLPALIPEGSCQRPLSLVLHKSTELMFDDAPHLQGRLQNFKELFVVDLNKAGLQCNSSLNYKDNVMNLSTAVRPQMLSDVIEETFADCRDEVAVQLGVADSLKKQVCSEQFFHGVLRLIRHANHEKGKLDESLIASIEGTLRNIEFLRVNKIETKLMFKGADVPGSKAEVPYFVDKVFEDDKNIWKVYVNAEAEDSLSKIYLPLTRVIAEACKGLLQEAVMFIPEMLRSDPNKIWSILDEMKIRQDDSYNASSSDLLPQPGSFIPIEDHHLLNETFENFTPGEYVGYEMDDPSMQHKEGDATFIYAVIIEEVNVEETSTLFGKFFKINVGHDKEPRVVEFADLYKFHRLQSSSFGLSDEQKTATKVRDKKKIFAEISDVLEEAWRLPEERRRKIVKRLFLRWHPDKNLGDETFCTEAFQHIQNEIARLEKVERREGERENHQSYYESFFSHWRERARRHNAQRREYKEAFIRNYGTCESTSRSGDSRSYIPPSFCKKNPQPGEAKRWFRQAEADLAAADNDLATEKPSYEWVCFKCHQVRPIVCACVFALRYTKVPSNQRNSLSSPSQVKNTNGVINIYV